MRKYSLSEIDEMREAIQTIMFGPLRWGGPASRDMTEVRGPQIEDRLRTYMMNGTEPEELGRAASVAADEWHRWQKEKGLR